MGGPLEKPDTKRSYLEFFELEQPPFAKPTLPSEIFHTDQNELLMAHLVNASEQPDCLVVISGAEGSGKTTLLSSFISDLDDEVSFACIDETCAGESEFYGAILEQIGFSDITGTPNELRNITKQFLVSRGMANDPVLIAIDNADRIRPAVLEQLRWVAAISADDRRVLSVVLAGTSQLLHFVNSPAMSQIEFKNQVYFNIRRYTEDELSKYIWFRLWWAGGGDSIKFSDDAISLVFRYTGGIARQINMLCNDVLLDACALQTHEITASLVRSAADRRQLLPQIVPLHGKGRRKTDPDFIQGQPELQAEELETAPATETLGMVESSVPESSASTAIEDDLREQLSSLRDQIGDLTADKMRALQDVTMRDEDVTELRNRLRAQTLETEKLANALETNSDEMRRQNEALAVSTKELRESEEATKKLGADLEGERFAAKTAQADIAKAEARAEELTQLRDKLDAQTAKTEELASALEDNADEIGQQNQALAESRKAMQESEEATKKLAADLEKERIASITAEAEIAKAKARTEELGQLREKLDAQSVEIERLTKELDNNSYEFRKQNLALVFSTKALQESEGATKELVADLEREKAAAKAALGDIAKAEARAKELGKLRDKLDAQTAKTEELSSALEDNADEIGRQNQALADSRKAMRKSEDAAKKLAANLEKEKIAAKIAQTDIARAKEKAEKLSQLKIEMQASIRGLTADLKKVGKREIALDALIEKLIVSEPACQTLEEFDRATYNCLFTTCEHMFKQNYSELQIADALRVQQAELIERRVPKASNKAVLGYARLIVDQLREFKMHGAGLCFGMRVPQVSGGHDGSPAISQKTREREHALLELTLRTYKADTELPTEDAVWPDIDPIFLELFEAYGEANVSAHFDDNAPNADKEMTSSISMSLYQKILKLPKVNAVNALRWILSP